MDNLDCSKALNGHKDLDKSAKENQIKNTLGSTISETALKKIDNILADIAALTILERLFLYLKLPTDCSKMSDPLRQPINPLGSRSEISQTIVWIKTHLEVDPELSLPKQDVYNDYFEFCRSSKVKPLSTADFGKVMKQVYPEVKPRRLGTRGNSRYCYAGLRRKMKLCSPLLPDMLDKSAEIPSAPSDLLNSAWEIIKEWSQVQLEISFPSMEALACHLILEFSIGKGTSAAAIITSLIREPCLDDQSGLLNRCKPQDTQVPVQRRVLKKNDNTRDHKRKMQIATPKIESRTRYKKRKAQSVPVTCDINMSETSEYGCDKMKGLACLQNLPDFSNFQKVATTTNSNGECDYVNRIHKEVDDITRNANHQFALEISTNGKVPIPRLSTEKVTPPKKVATPTKYKIIQPKPEINEIAVGIAAAGGPAHTEHALIYVNGSHPSPSMLDDVDAVGKLPKEDHTMISIIKNELASEYNDGNVPLSRERLISLSNIDKDAFDYYLGANNSQEHEEELTQYFDDKTESSENQSKLSQLRQLLISKQKHTLPTKTHPDKVVEELQVAFNFPTNTSAPINQPISNLPNFSMLNPRRRVSFDVPFPDEGVPPSPNTRRKNFNFTPISPTSLSPTGGHSKGSSGTTSPFVSPNNTPVPRGKLCALQKPFEKKLKLNQYLHIETFNNHEDKHYVSPEMGGGAPMSAPVSPRFKRCTTRTNYSRCTAYSKKPTNDSLSSEITELLSNKYAGPTEVGYRSQSVPLREMYLKGDLMPSLSQQTVNQALFHGTFFPEKPATPPDFNVAKLDTQSQNTTKAAGEQSMLLFNRNVARPSVGVEPLSRYPPSRSVPGTPVPTTTADKGYRSYPSTPITNDIFCYSHSQDFLLNGQPIQACKDTFLSTDLPFDTPQDFNVVSTGILIDDNKCHFNFDGQLSNMEFSAKDNLEALQDTCLVTEEEFNFKNIDFSET